MSTIVYAVAWLIFAVFHSLLARPTLQNKLELFLGGYYRLTYNLLAVIKFSVVIYIGHTLLTNERFDLLDSYAAMPAFQGLRVVGFLVFSLALLTYDLGRFSGITQAIKGERVSDSANEPLQRRFLNRWIRHPLYTGAFLILWGGAVSPLGFWTALWGTLYLVIGTVFEERKLTNIYGDEYRLYQKEVPRYFPAMLARK